MVLETVGISFRKQEELDLTTEVLGLRSIDAMYWAYKPSNPLVSLLLSFLLYKIMVIVSTLLLSWECFVAQVIPHVKFLEMWFCLTFLLVSRQRWKTKHFVSQWNCGSLAWAICRESRRDIFYLNSIILNQL